jgi:hypothetical protein
MPPSRTATRSFSARGRFVADEERAPTAGDRVIEELLGDQALPCAGRRIHAQPERLHVKAAQDIDQLRVEPREGPLLTRDMGVDVGDQVEGLTKEGMDPLCVGTGLARDQEGLDPFGKPPAARRVDDAACIQRRGVEVRDPVVRTVDEIVELEVGLVMLGQLEFLSDPVQRSAHLLADGPGPFRVDLDQAVLRLLDRTVLLLDDEYLTGLIHDDEVELAELDPVPVFRDQCTP